MVHTANDFRTIRMVNKKRNLAKKQKIVRQWLFFSFLFIFAIVSSLVITSVAGANYTEIMVYSVNTGDTLWSIAAEHNQSGLDIREHIFQIKKVNQLQSSTIYAGQILEIPLH